jgi:hypothetical protein
VLTWQPSTRRRFIPILSMEGPTMNSTVCPCGGFHEFEPVKGENDFIAGLAAGACSTCLFCIWWPLLLCGAWLCWRCGAAVGACRACAACGVVLAPARSALTTSPAKPLRAPLRAPGRPGAGSAACPPLTHAPVRPYAAPACYFVRGCALRVSRWV